MENGFKTVEEGAECRVNVVGWRWFTFEKVQTNLSRRRKAAKGSVKNVRFSVNES